MEIKSPIKAEIVPVRAENERKFNLYALWRSIPIVTLKKMSRNDLMNAIGVEDEDVLEVLDCHTQNDFAEKYNLSKDTLTDWNKKINLRDPLFEAKAWMKHLTKNMLMSLYVNAITKGDGNLYKLWFQVSNDWSEKSKVIHEMPEITFNIKVREKINGPTDAKPITGGPTVPPIAEQPKAPDNRVGNDGKASGRVGVSGGQGN